MSEEVAALLREVRDNQREAIAAQREHLALYKAQHARWMRMTRVVGWLVIPGFLILLALLLWPYIDSLYRVLFP